MPDVPRDTPTGLDEDSNDKGLQGYQDDLDTSGADQFANDAGSDPSDEMAATRTEFRQGLRDSEAPEQEGGTARDELNPDDPEPPMASPEDYRETIEDGDEADQDSRQAPWV